MSQTRVALKAASEQVSKLNNEIARLESAAPLAEQAIVDAEAELVNYDNLEQQITKWRTGQLKKGKSTKTLPEGLRAKLDAKRVASEELDRSRDTHQAIENELAELRKKVKQGEADRIKYAVAVLHELADGLADELLALNARRQELTAVLQGLAEVSAPIDGAMRFVGNSPKARAALDSGSGGLSSWPGGVSPLAANAKRWIARLNALLEDAAAEVTIPKPVQPGDVIMGSMPTFGMGILSASFELRPEA